MHLTLTLSLLAAAAAPSAGTYRPASAAPVPSIATIPVGSSTGSMPNGKVEGLSDPAFTTFQQIKRRNIGNMTERDAKELRDALLRDGKIDPNEADLLRELTQTQFRQIAVSQAGAAATAPKVTTFPVSGAGRTVLLDVLNPPLDLAQAWGNGQAGWNAILAEYKKGPAKEAGVLRFVEGKVAEQWALSNNKNGYKPLRDLIGRYHGFSNAAGSDANTGRTLLYKACENVDRGNADAMPDFLYNWVRPGGYL